MLGISTETILITICCVLIIMLILYVVLFVMFRNMKNRYRQFMSGDDGKSLEKSIARRLDEIEGLKSDRETMLKRLDALEANELFAYRKVALLKYDAFQEMGGKLSFSLCMLDGNEDGFLLTSMHSSREGCYTYVKEIINGEAFVLLSEEEKKTLEEAKAKGMAK